MRFRNQSHWEQELQKLVKEGVEQGMHRESMKDALCHNTGMIEHYEKARRQRVDRAELERREREAVFDDAAKSGAGPGYPGRGDPQGRGFGR